MKLAFTGTRRGLTSRQRDSLGRLLRGLVGRAESVHEFHAGCAEGADAEAMALADEFAIPITGHPSNIVSQTSAEALALCTETNAPLPPLERNGNIVAACDALVACPAEMEEQVRSGTWSTVRKARWKELPIWVIYPDGDVVKEEQP